MHGDVAERAGHAAAACDSGQFHRVADEAGDVEIGGDVVHLEGCADLHDAAIAQHRDEIGGRERLLLVMRDEQRGRAEAAQELDKAELNSRSELASKLAEPRVYGRRGPAKPPLREFGNDPVSGKPVVAKDGKFGVYVTDGETNASLTRGDRLEYVTPERAFELLAIRRDADPSTKRKPAKKAAKKASAKPAKKAAKRPAKKAAKNKA